MKTLPLYCSLLALLTIGTPTTILAATQTGDLISVHENIRTTPYPQENTPLYLNPSPLIVPANMRKATFLQFQLSQDATFPKDKTIESKPLAWCMFNPHRTLEKGTWHWRFRSVDNNGKSTEWSKIYNFNVVETPSFVTPSFDTFLKKMPKGYPRLYCFLDKGLESGKATVTTHPEYKEMVHRAGTALKNTYETSSQPYNSIGKISTDINYLYTAYRSTGEKVYSDKMLKIIRTLLTVPQDEKLNNDFVCGDMIFIFTHVYDACYNQLTEAEKRELKGRTFAAAKYHHMIQRKGFVENHIFDNHYWQRAFREMLQIGLMFADTDSQAKEILEYCYELWTARAPASGFNRDGEWHNGQGYFTANVKTLWYVPALFSYMTGTDFLQHPFYKNLGKALVYAWPPRTMSAGFGDGNESTPVPNRQRVALADYIARETHDPYAMWYCNVTKTYLSDFDMRLYRIANRDKQYPTVQILPDDAPKALWMQDTGEMLVNSHLRNVARNLFVSFRSSPFGSGSHTLSDQNSFNVSYKGVPVYRSGGYYLNFSDPHNLLSYRHTRAHNTLLVDGIGQPFTIRAYGNVTRMLTGENISYACGDASHAYCGLSDYPMWKKNFKNAGVEESAANGFGTTNLKKYRRHIAVLHPNIIVLYDELEATKPVQWDWLLHSPIQFKLENNGKDKKLISRFEDKKFTSTVYMFSNSDCKLSQTDQYVSPPDPKKMRKGRSYPAYWNMTATYNKSTANRILTVICLQDDGAKRMEVVHDKNGTPNDFIIAGKWKLRVQLDTGKPAELMIRDPKAGTLFSLGDKNLKIEGQDYKREKGTSVLYDIMDGKWTIHEMDDRAPMPTCSDYNATENN